MYHILICDDDKDIVSALKIYLSNPAYQIYTAYNGKDALEVCSRKEIHLVLLDIMMPQLDGISVTAKLRESYNMPILILTAKGEDEDIVLGLNVGADDYITKPFRPSEVVARVNSHLRRYTRLGADTAQEEELAVGGILLNDAEKTVTVDGEPVGLTPKEFDILKLLMRSPGKVFSPKEIYTLVWKEKPMQGSDNTVAVHIRHLREKIEINPNEPRCVKVVFGQGYKIEGGRDQ